MMALRWRGGRATGVATSGHYRPVGRRSVWCPSGGVCTARRSTRSGEHRSPRRPDCYRARHEPLLRPSAVPPSSVRADAVRPSPRPPGTGVVVTAVLAGIVAERAEEPAVIDERGATTWLELDERVTRLVHALRDRGLVTGDTVLTMLGNQVEFIEVTLACAHGGWLLVPVNWHWVPREVAYVLADADARAVVVDARWASVMADAVSDAGVAPPSSAAWSRVTPTRPTGSSPTRRCWLPVATTRSTMPSGAARCSTRRGPPVGRRGFGRRSAPSAVLRRCSR